jgi:hypothetical protein
MPDIVHTTYGHTGESSKTNKLGMREMQEKALPPWFVSHESLLDEFQISQRCNSKSCESDRKYFSENGSPAFLSILK